MFVTNSKKSMNSISVSGIPTSILTKLHRPAALVLSILICLLIGCARTRYEASHIYPLCEKPYEECPVKLCDYKSVQQRANGQDPNLALAVAISGGGPRAANFCAGALLELEQTTNYDSTQNNILCEVDYFSTVSGGGFAAAAYISSLYDHLYFKKTYDGYSFASALRYPPEDYQPVKCPCKKPPADDEVIDPCIRRHLKGFYPDIIKDMVKDVLSLLLPGLFSQTGSFEQSIDNNILGYRWRKMKLQTLAESQQRGLSLTLADVFVSKDDPNTKVRLPYWVANATAYENGAIFTFTPDYLKLYKIYGYKHRSKEYKLTTQRSSDEFIWKMPLSVAATASASFPVATYPTTLWNSLDPNNPYLHLYDGGMAENLGVITAVRLLDNDCEDTVTTKALIVIDAYQGTFAPFSNTRRPPPVGKTAIRALDIYLDSWRGRYREIVRSLCSNKGVGVVFISFDELAELTDCGPLLDFGLDPNDVIKLTAKSDCGDAPFNLLRSISTLKLRDKGKLSSAEQNLLLAAGRYAAEKKKDDILNILNW